MSSNFAPESLLALRQVVDEKLTTQDVENILKTIQDKENLSKEMIQIYGIDRAGITWPKAMSHFWKCMG